MAYATEEQLATYMGKSVADLPDDAERLLERASEFIDRYSLGRINTEKERHENAAQEAACAQVEWWLVNEDEYERLPHYSQYQVGDFTVHTSDGKGLPRLAPRAFAALFIVGLMRRGVSTR